MGLKLSLILPMFYECLSFLYECLNASENANFTADSCVSEEISHTDVAGVYHYHSNQRKYFTIQHGGSKLRRKKDSYIKVYF